MIFIFMLFKKELTLLRRIMQNNIGKLFIMPKEGHGGLDLTLSLVIFHGLFYFAEEVIIYSLARKSWNILRVK